MNRTPMAQFRHRQDQYARIPYDSISDTQLSDSAFRVLCFLCSSCSPSNCRVWVGQRLIARKVGMHQNTVALALEILKHLDYIDVLGEGMSRRTYIVKFNMFGWREGMYQPKETGY